jgi:hypothetical protein
LKLLVTSRLRETPAGRRVFVAGFIVDTVSSKTTEMKVARGVMKKQGPVSAVFQNREKALEAYQALLERGYGTGEVRLLISPETHHSVFGQALDYSSGGTAFFDQPSSTAPAHDSIREVTSIDSIVDAGISVDRASVYDQQIKAGGVVIAVIPKGPTDRYTIGQYWRQAKGEWIFGDDEDF